MKIVIIHFGKKGAGPIFNFEMAKALHKAGHCVVVYASSKVENRKALEEQPFKTRFFETYFTKLEYLLSIITWYKIARVLSAIKKDNPDVVYSTMNDMWAPFIFPHITNAIRVKTIHDIGIHEGNDGRINKWWNNSNFKDADKYIVLSKKFVSALVERGIKEENVCVIPHAGFDYYLKGNTQPYEVNCNLALFFGRIDQYKGLEYLIDAFELVLGQNHDAQLRIAGNGHISEEAMAKIKSMGTSIDLQNRWIKDEDVKELVKDAAFVVLPYTHATQSGVIPLAYAFSKPVIATRVGCLDEQVVDGETGYMINSKDVKELANKISMLLDNPSTTAEMGKNANDYMQKNLTWDASASLLLNFITK